MDSSKLRYHVDFWRREYLRRATRHLAQRLPAGANQELVRALEIAGQPMEMDLTTPDPHVPLFVHQTHTLSDAVSLEIPAQTPSLSEDGHWWPPVRVHVLRHAHLDIRTGLAFAGDRVVSQSGSGHRWSRDEAFVSGAARRVQQGHWPRISTPIASLGQVNNFYHFMIEALPRLLRIRSLAPDVRFLTAEEIPSFALEGLRLVGLDASVVEAKGVVKSDSLWICEPQPLFWPHPDDLRVTASAMGAAAGADTVDSANRAKSIYISRSRASRSILNEPALEAHLQRRGFEIVHLDSLTLSEQIHRITAAELIVAPHGGGLANLMFMRPGGRVVELSSGMWWWPCFRRMAHSLGLNYTLALLSGDAEAPHGRADEAVSVVEQVVGGDPS